MNSPALHTHAVDSLLKAHRTDAERLPAPADSRFTRDQIVIAIKRWHDQYGEPPKVFDWDPSWARRRGEDWRAERFEAGDWPTVAIVRRQFGNMSKALFAAGVRPGLVLGTSVGAINGAAVAAEPSQAAVAPVSYTHLRAHET